MNYLSVCSGIEAASVAWQPRGWEPVAFSEIDKAASRLLAHKYPNTPNWGDMSNFKEWPDATVDVLCGGTPCQSFSVAGLRKGLDDPRGNLMLTFGAIAGRYRPRWLVWENVPGVLSSNGGRDFGAFLGMLGELGYGFAYRVLDAQHVRTRRFPFAVPQRRRRVFVVGYLGDWRRAAAVLFDRESLSGHPAPRRKAGQGSSRGVEFGPSGGGFADVNTTLDARAKDGPIRNQLAGAVLCADIAPTLNAHFGDKQGLEDQHINGGGACLSPPVAMSLNAHGVRLDAESETLLPTTGGGFDVAHALRGEGFDASEDGTGRGTPIVPVAFRQCAPALTSNYGKQVDNSDTSAGPMLVPVAFVPVAVSYRIAGDGAAYEEGSIAAPLTTGTDSSANAIAIQERAICENPNAGPDGAGVKADGSSCTLEARTVPQAVAFVQNTRDEVRLMGGDGAIAGALAAEPGMKQQCYIARPWAVRRLTPRECERLQGFPDDYTQIPNGNKPTADGPRYKQLGNSWAVNCIDWLGERIDEVDAW